MKDSFIFEGKKYISAKRASEISSYASDYVGQLCRAGKLDCRMVGRSWFVTEESLHLHKAAISREEGQRSRIENLRGKPKVEIKIPEVVKKEIVNEVPVESPKEFIPEIPKKLPSEKREIIVYSVNQSLVVPSKIDLNQNKNEIKDFIKDELKKKSVSPWTVEDLSVKSPYIYSNDDRPLLPDLKKKITSEQNDSKTEVNKIESPIKVQKEKESRDEQKNISSAVGETGNKIEINKVSPKIEKVIVQEIEKINKKKVRSPIVKKETIENVKKVGKQFSQNLITYEKLARKIILQRVIVPVAILALFFGVGTGTYIIGSSVVEKISPEVNRVAVVAKVNVGNAFDSIASSLSNGYKSVVSFFTSPARLAMNNDKHFGDVTVSEVTPNGIVLTSSTGSSDEDDAMKQKIRGSFSDDVEINKDNSGTAGVITPVFKDTKGKDFIYVMVPVKDKNASETK